MCSRFVTVDENDVEVATEGVVPTNTKKRYLSLSLKKRPKVSELPQSKAMCSRLVIVDENDLELAAEGVVPTNMAKNNAWAARNFSEWVKARNLSSYKVMTTPTKNALCLIGHSGPFSILVCMETSSALFLIEHCG